MLVSYVDQDFDNDLDLNVTETLVDNVTINKLLPMKLCNRNSDILPTISKNYVVKGRGRGGYEA